MKVSALLIGIAVSSDAFSTPSRSAHPSTALYSVDDAVDKSSRRQFFTSAVATAAAGLAIASSPSASYASGGATAGKYTTIPIAKRRYYGRVQEAVHEFLLMAPAVIKGDMTDPTIQVSQMRSIEVAICTQ